VLIEKEIITFNEMLSVEQFPEKIIGGSQSVAINVIFYL